MSGYICRRLAKKEGYWRVDGVGTVKVLTKQGPRLRFLFSKVEEKNLKNPYRVSEKQESFSLAAHSSWLRIFTTGSIWHNGKKIQTPETNVTIRVNTSRCCYTFPDKIPQDFAPFKTLLPDTHLNFSGNINEIRQTQFALVRAAENDAIQWLIIPTAELFRFYLGSSSRLISSAMTATVDSIIRTKDSFLKDGELTIFDAVGDLTKREALCFGRTLVSPEAREAFFRPHKYLALAQASNADPDNRPPLFIKSIFPFLGDTTLQVAGKKIPLRNIKTQKKEWAVFVMQIRDCSYPFGIDFVEIRREGRVASKGDGEGQGGAKPPPRNRTDLDDPKDINDDPADPTLGTLVRRHGVFSLEQINKIPCEVVTNFKERDGTTSSGNGNNVRGYTFDDASNRGKDSGNQKVEDIDVNILPVSRSITLFIKAIQHLRTTKSNTLSIKTRGSQRDDRLLEGEIVTRFPTLQTRHNWYKIKSDNPSLSFERCRKIVWAEVEIKGKSIHLFEMELQEEEPGKSLLAVIPRNLPHGTPNLDTQDVKNLLRLTAVQRGWPSEQHIWEGKLKAIAVDFFSRFSLSRLKHTHVAVNKKKLKEAHKNKTKTKTNVVVNKSQIDSKVWAEDIYDAVIELT